MFKNRKKVNPFDKLSALHNDGLEFIIQKLSEIKKENLTNEQVIESICDFFKQFAENASKTVDPVYYAALSDTLNKDGGGQVADKIDSAAMKLIDDIRALDTEDAVANNLIREIEAVEAIAWQSDLSEEGRSIVLLYAAVSKTSIKFWDAEKKKGKESRWRKWLGGIKRLPWRADADGVLEGLVDCAKEGVIDMVIEVITSISLPHVGFGIKIVKIVGTGIYRSVEEYIDPKEKPCEEKKPHASTAQPAQQKPTQPIGQTPMQTDEDKQKAAFDENLRRLKTKKPGPKL